MSTRNDLTKRVEGFLENLHGWSEDVMPTFSKGDVRELKNILGEAINVIAERDSFRQEALAMAKGSNHADPADVLRAVDYVVPKLNRISERIQYVCPNVSEEVGQIAALLVMGLLPEAALSPATKSPAMEASLASGTGSATACNCNLRTKLVGDGCSVCNPEYAARFTGSEVGK